MKCSKCGKEIPDNSKFCEFCGEPVEHSHFLGKQILKWSVLIIPTLVVLFFALTMQYWRYHKIINGNPFDYLGQRYVSVDTHYIQHHECYSREISDYDSCWLPKENIEYIERTHYHMNNIHDSRLIREKWNDRQCKKALGINLEKPFSAIAIAGSEFSWSKRDTVVFFFYEKKPLVSMSFGNKRFFFDRGDGLTVNDMLKIYQLRDIDGIVRFLIEDKDLDEKKAIQIKENFSQVRSRSSNCRTDIEPFEYIFYNLLSQIDHVKPRVKEVQKYSKSKKDSYNGIAD